MLSAAQRLLLVASQHYACILRPQYCMESYYCCAVSLLLYFSVFSPPSQRHTYTQNKTDAKKAHTALGLELFQRYVALHSIAIKSICRENNNMAFELQAWDSLPSSRASCFPCIAICCVSERAFFIILYTSPAADAVASDCCLCFCFAVIFLLLVLQPPKRYLLIPFEMKKKSFERKRRK